MISFSLAKPEVPPAIRHLLPRLGAGIAVTALADWLFYLRPPGISVTIFAAALGAVVLLTNPVRAGRIGFLASTLLLVVALLPSVEAFGTLSFLFAIFGAAVFALLVTGWSAHPVIDRIADVAWMIIGGPFRLVDDVSEAAREARERDAARHGADWLKAWIVPLGVGTVFLALFAAANPVIENWFSGSGAWRWQDIDAGRVFSWVVVFGLIWSFLHVRVTSRAIPFGLPDTWPEPPAEMAADATQSEADAGVLFGRTAIVRSLVLFNALFALQTAMDVTYLWSGVALPAGMTYASYAHRGAYSLIVTALLSAAFVLAAMRPGSDTERSRPIRMLVYLWIGQNVLLVVSSILRLDLYVDTYSLTAWRCAAFVWMLLVAAGLVLIMARIALGRSNVWLVWRNVGTLVMTLYVCAFVDFPAVIADFNVAHSLEVTGEGLATDVGYLCDLGPAAIPALGVLETKMTWPMRRLQIRDCRERLITLHRTRQKDWRAFGFRDYRLGRKLDRQDDNSDAPGDRPAARVTGEANGAPHPGG
jgi:hypothetical protein